MEEILNYFTEKISIQLENEIKDKFDTLEEIRLRVERPIVLKFKDNDKVIKYNVTTEDILSTLQILCENSIYTYQGQIAEGFITVKGGHRVGISGSCAIENGKVINIKYIYSLNFRIARQVIGSSNPVLRHILNLESNSIYNTLIVSAPGTGKTTIYKFIFIVSENKSAINDKNKIIYKLNGGLNNDKNITKYANYSVDENMTNYNLYDPTKENSTFLGWYLDENFTERVTTIDSSLSGEIILYAKWSD